jgi:ABC-type sugar transport system ATPase subunit
MMVGRHLNLSARPSRALEGSVVLAVRELTTHKLKGVSFELRRGEVLGIAGLVGAGRSELGAALFGLDRIQRGSLLIRGEPYAPAGAADAQRLGVGLVPEDRKLQGLMLDMSVRENSTLAVLGRLSRWGVVRAAAEQALFAPAARQLQLKYAAAELPVRSLSGGNQQKTLLARSLFADPDILFLDDPARGVDVGAKEDIYLLIDELAKRGKGILLASSELAELLRCADRILVLNNGRVGGLYPAAEVTQEMILSAAAAAVSFPQPAG